ncbi:MAG: tetratricopeptide repeat protein, partial [Spirochaetales bacterium]|nr:tetratricopeptide repeat protein [Spirochaetales bacterium]
MNKKLEEFLKLLGNTENKEILTSIINGAMDVDFITASELQELFNLLAQNPRIIKPAMVFLEKAVALEPKNASIWLTNFDIYKELGLQEKAVDCINQAIQLQPSNSELYIRKATYLNMIKNYSEAIECCGQGLAFEPENTVLLMEKGIGLKHLGQYEKAIKIYNQGLEINPDDADLIYNKLTVYIQLNKYDIALPLCNKVLSLTPLDPDTWYYKYCSLFYLKRYEDAFPCAVKTLELNNRSQVKRHLLSDSHSIAIDLVDKQQYNLALNYLNLHLKYNPDNADAWYLKIFCLGPEKEESEEILLCLSKVIELDPNKVAAWFNRGMILTQKGEYEEAFTCFQTAQQKLTAFG